TYFQLLSILQSKANFMSDKTRSTHEALAKALTIHALLPLYVTTAMGALTAAQLLFEMHTENIESLEYDFAVLPTLVHPCLTLYFVKPYR
ncbi:hypothetical protein PMAYCL1PPCAC_33043, partial [Pristionchus mayeri]